MADLPDPLLSCAWLVERLDAPDIRILDATTFLPGDPRNARALFAERRIPGAIFFDIEEIADTDNPLPHMLARPEKFAARMKKLGVGDGARVIVYDNQGLFSAARVWWNFRVMGHDDVAVLDGGFPAWERAGLPIETGQPQARMERHFTPRVRTDLVRDIADVRRAIADNGVILDARSAARFRGEAPEPRPGVRGGHMPGARSVPYTALLDENALMRSADELRRIFAEDGGGASKPAPICSCGTGITAAVIALALARIGRWDASIYDGSWVEWGGRKDTPVVTGA